MSTPGPLGIRSALVLGHACALLFGVGLESLPAHAFESVGTSSQEIEGRCLGYINDRLQRGFVRLRITHRSPGPGNEVEFEMTFDGVRVRRDRWVRRSGHDEWVGPDRVIITESEYVDAPGRDLSTTIAPRSDFDRVGDIRQHFGVFRPSLLATTLSGLTDWEVSGQLLDRADRTDIVLSEEILDGLDTLRLDYRLEGGSAVSVWYAPTQGFGIVAATRETSTDRGVLYQSLKVQRKQYPDGNLWYPCNVSFLDKLDGETVLDDVIVVEEARFGPVDESMFTLKKLGLSPGEMVLDRRDGGQRGLIWSGEELIKGRPQPEARGQGKGNRIFWIANAIVLLCVAVYAILRSRR